MGAAPSAAIFCLDGTGSAARGIRTAGGSDPSNHWPPPWHGAPAAPSITTGAIGMALCMIRRSLSLFFSAAANA